MASLKEILFNPAASFSSRPEIAWVHTVAEILMALSFYLLTIVLIYFLRERKDLKLRGSFLPVLLFFFVAVVHTIHLLAPWYPVYSLELALKFVTSLFAVLAVIFIRRLIPLGLRLPHPNKIKEANEKLNHETAAYKQNEQSLLEAQKKMKLAHQEKIQELNRNQEMLENEIQKSGKEIELLPAIMQSLGEITDFHAALEIIVGKICEIMEWDYSETWVVAEN